MAHVIDALVIELGLDPKKFIEGQREALAAFKKTEDASQSFGKNIEAAGAKISDIFSVVKRGAVGLVAGFVGGEVAEFLDNVARMTNSIGLNAKTIGASIPNLATWQNMVGLLGGNAEEATASLGGLQDAINNVLQGGGMFEGKFAYLLNRIGSNRGDSADSILRKLVVFFEQEKQAGRINDTQAATYLRSVPGMTPGMINLILQGVDAFKKLEDAAKANVPTAEDVALAAQYVEQTGQLEQSMKKLALTTFPALTFAADWLNETLTVLTIPFRALGWAYDKLLGGEPARKFMEGFNGTGGSPGSGPQVKSGAGAVSPAMKQLTDLLQGSVPGIGRFTSYDDAYHAGTSSKHAQGLALDFTLTDPSKAASVVQDLKRKLSAMGLDVTVLDEYNHPSKNATGGHLHVQFNSANSTRGFTGAPAAATARGGGQTSSNSTTTSTVNIDKLHVMTNATDADGMARGAKGALERVSIAMPANSALV